MFAVTACLPVFSWYSFVSDFIGRLIYLSNTILLLATGLKKRKKQNIITQLVYLKFYLLVASVIEAGFTSSKPHIFNPINSAPVCFDTLFH